MADEQLHYILTELRVANSRKTPNHAIHFVLTLWTFGIWGIGWIIISAQAKSENERIEHEIRTHMANSTPRQGRLQ